MINKSLFNELISYEDNNNNMIKKIMTIGVLGASTLGMMAANASPNGVYVTGQLGYANTHMKNKIVLSGAEGSGFSIPNNTSGGRLALGYQFNPYLAVEMGYMRLLKQKGTLKLAPTSAWAAGSETLAQNAFDVAAKGIIPISDKLNIYGKIGVAYLTSTITSDFNSIQNNQNDYFGIAKHKFAPEAAVGVSYNITHNVALDTSWTHIQPLGKNRPGNIDFVAVGIGYSFG